MATHPTTAEAIRDRIIEVFESELVPSLLPSDRWRAYRNEYGADFIEWAETNPQGAFRRFQVRDTGEDAASEVTNVDVELRQVTFSILVAYPQDARYGRDQALDRDDVSNADEHQLEQAIGILGRPRFTYPFPDATWQSEGSSANRLIGNACDFLEIVKVYTFYRSMT